MTPTSGTACRTRSPGPATSTCAPGTVLRSNEGNPLATVVANEIDRQDTIGGACGKESNTLRYGHHTAAEHGCRENFLAEAAKYGMGARDIVSNLNWFMNVPVEADGTLGIVDGISAPGKRVAFRAEMDILVLVSNCPQMNNPCNDFNPTPLRMIVTAGSGVSGWPERLGVRHRPRRQPRRDRPPRHPHRAPPGPADGRRLLHGRPRRAARPRGRRGGTDRPGQASRFLPERRRASCAAAKSAGAGAIHPGYGFLSENADFARPVEEAGIAFVGPTPAQLEAFGAKHTARELARAAGVPMMAGTGLLAIGRGGASRAAREIGFPVMVKATGGGGGIGMLACHRRGRGRRRVRPGPAARHGQLRQPAASSLSGSCGRPGTSRSRSSATATGQVAVLGDRDCSLQRRNQKVHRGGPGPRAAAVTAPPVARGGAGPRRVGRLPLGRHRRVRVRPGAAGGIVPRGERPAAGRAPGHRGGVPASTWSSRCCGWPARARRASRGSWRRGTCRAATRSRPASTPRIPTTAAARAPAWSPPSPGRRRGGVRVDGVDRGRA